MSKLFESGIGRTGKLKSIDALYYGLVNKWYGYWLTYKENRYYLCCCQEESTNMFTIGRTWLDEGSYQYETFEELLDNFKEKDKTLRDMIPDIEKLRLELVKKQNSYHLTYNGNVYYICRYPKKGKEKFALLLNPDFEDWNYKGWDIETKFMLDSFEGLLDKLMVWGGSLRDFIFEADAEAEEYNSCILEYILDIVSYLNTGGKDI